MVLITIFAPALLSRDAAGLAGTVVAGDSLGDRGGVCLLAREVPADTNDTAVCPDVADVQSAISGRFSACCSGCLPPFLIACTRSMRSAISSGVPDERPLSLYCSVLGAIPVVEPDVALSSAISEDCTERLQLYG